jgi:hypothetical protein
MARRPRFPEGRAAMTNPFADHQHTLPDGRSNSGGSRRQLFIHPLEFGARVFGALFFGGVGFVFGMAICIYALLIA